MPESNLNDTSYSLPGNRLEHLLDQIDFIHGRGRMKLFHELIASSTKYDFKDLKYTTVRSWFHNHAPTIRKVNAIIDILSEKYTFEHDIEQIANWWKVGGYYPYQTSIDSADLDKLDIVISSLIAKELKGKLDNMPASELVTIKNEALTFCKAFANPNQKKCPNIYIRMYIRDKLNSYRQ